MSDGVIESGGLTYRDAGVDTVEGQRAVSLMKEHVRRTFGPEVLTGLGSFGSLFQPDLSGIRTPVLVAGTDGVGTKLKIAILMDKHDTVGRDLVAMCVNDVLCQGARPLFFLDYIATGHVRAEKIAEIVSGVACGCEIAGCALVGGETAEMPGFYADGDYDMAGFCVGIVDRDSIIDGSGVAEGDVLVGIASSGLHSNGYSLVRKLFFERLGLGVEACVDGIGGGACAPDGEVRPGGGDAPDGEVCSGGADAPVGEVCFGGACAPVGEVCSDSGAATNTGGATLGDILLTPTRIYAKQAMAAFNAVRPHAVVHITGGGFYENIPRILPEGKGLGATITSGSWEIPPIFKLIQAKADMTDREMFSTLNMGIGMIFVVAPGDKEALIKALEGVGEKAFEIGRVARGSGVKIK